ncbi:MAG: acyl-CoA thioesterase [Desulfurococcales archaeon]|nr:acyl-CoA thioesterase [Desulfurococcales archaeon]
MDVSWSGINLYIGYLLNTTKRGDGQVPLYSRKYRVYWSETDAARIVHFSNYFRYCERTEEEFLYELAGGKYNYPIEASGSEILMPRVHAECDYEFPLFPGDTFRVDIVDVVLGNKSITYTYEIYNESKGGVKAARCSIVVVALDVKSMKGVPIPGHIREMLLNAGARIKG